MKPSHEVIQLPDAAFPVRALLRSYRNEPYIFVHPHWHSAVEVLYILEGSATQQVNDRIFEAGRDSLVVIPGGHVHSTYASRGANNEILVVQFDMAYVQEGINVPDFIDTALSPGKEAAECMMAVYEEIRERRDGFELFVKSHIFRFSGILAREFGYKDRPKQDAYLVSKAKDMLKNTFALIDEKFAQEITLDMAARASNLSVPHFCRLFRKSMGMTFMEYLTFYRVNRAEELLKTSRHITEIAYECGFGSLSAFIRAFRKFRSITPSEYRNRDF